MTHHLKCWPEPFKALRQGTKQFEYRYDDRGFAFGDRLEIHEWDPHKSGNTGEVERRWVSYILRGQFGVPEGYVVMSLIESEPNK